MPCEFNHCSSSFRLKTEGHSTRTFSKRAKKLRCRNGAFCQVIQEEKGGRRMGKKTIAKFNWVNFGERETFPRRK